MSESTTPNGEEEHPTSAEEIIEKHGRTVLEEMAANGNIAAQAALELVDERGEGK